MAGLDASVIIVNYNNAGYSIGAAKSVLKRGFAKGEKFEIILVDNGSNPPEAGKLEKAFAGRKNVRVVSTGKNLGYTGGTNYAVPMAGARYIIVLSNDVIVDKGWGTALLEKLGPGVAVVSSARIKEWKEKSGRTGRVGGANLVDRGIPDLLDAPFPGVGGCSFAFDRRLVKKPFDDDYFMYYEDAQLSNLVRLRGLEIRLAPDSSLMHYGSATVGKKSFLKTFYSERNRLLNILTTYSAPTEMKLLPLVIADVAAVNLASCVALDGQTLEARLKAYWWILANSGKVLEKREKMQKARRAGDEELLKFHSCKMLPGKGTVGKIVNAAAETYCRLVGLHCYEFGEEFKKRKE